MRQAISHAVESTSLRRPLLPSPHRGQPRTPAKHRRLGRSTRGFDRAAWDRERVIVALADNYTKIPAKVTDTRHSLLSVHLWPLVGEGLLFSRFDPLWGVGLPDDGSAAQQPSTWRGKSLLGYVLQNLRQLRREADTLYPPPPPTCPSSAHLDFRTTASTSSVQVDGEIMVSLKNPQKYRELLSKLHIVRNTFLGFRYEYIFQVFKNLLVRL